MAIIDMSRFDDHPASFMARNRALRELDDTMSIEDKPTRFINLVLGAVDGVDLVHGYGKGIDELFTAEFRQGIRVALVAVTASGDINETTLTTALQAGCIETTLDSCLVFEEATLAEGGDIADVHLRKDGGNG